MPTLNRTSLADLNVFMTIVRRLSFREAANELDVTTSALSHSMRHLESRLGVKLLNRTSRSVVPTLAGAALAERLEQGFQTISEALGDLDRFRGTPAGRLRINVPRDAARLLLSPALPKFLARYADLELDLTVEDRPVDIVAEGYDAGIRYGGTVPQDMVAVPLTGKLRWVVVGAPAYLTRRGTPQIPADLLSHACVRMRLGDNSTYKWELGEGSRAIKLDVHGRISANETESAVLAAINGVALTYCLERRVEQELRSGLLKIVLPDWSVMGPPFCMYYPSRRQTPPGLQQLIECLRAKPLSLTGSTPPDQVLS